MIAEILVDPYFLVPWLSWLILGIYMVPFHTIGKKIIETNFYLKILIVIIASTYFPLVEESLFRHTLPVYFGDFPGFKYINAILFGLIHLMNAQHSDSLKITLLQMCFTTWFGWYLINLNNFVTSLHLHMLLNFTNLIIVMIVTHIYHYFNITKKIPKSDLFFDSVFAYGLRRAISENDIFKKNEKREYLVFCTDDLPEDISDSIQKYEDIKSNRRRRRL